MAFNRAVASIVLVVPIDPDAPPIPNPYQTADVLNGQVNTYQSLASGPIVNGLDGLPVFGSFVLGENGTAFGLGNTGINSFNVAAGSINWSYQNSNGISFAGYTAGGGITVVDGQSNQVVVDSSGNAGAPVALAPATLLHDLDRALNFYVDMLGFEKRADISNQGFRWLTVAQPSPATALRRSLQGRSRNRKKRWSLGEVDPGHGRLSP